MASLAPGNSKSNTSESLATLASTSLGAVAMRRLRNVHRASSHCKSFEYISMSHSVHILCSISFGDVKDLH